MGVVGGRGAVAGDQHQAGEAGGQRHRPQNGLGRVDARAEVGGGVERRRGVGRGPRMKTQRVAQQLRDVERARGLDEGEGGDGGELEPAPGAHGAPGDAGARVAALGVRRPARERGREEHRRARLRHVGGTRMVAHREAEEAREAQRADARRRGLERPTVHLRAHVDAEGGLRLGPLVARALGGPGQGRGQASLRRALGCVLEGGVHDLVRRGRQGLGVGGADLGPARPDPVAVEEQQRLLPHQAHGQEVLQRGVVSVLHLRLPQPVAGELRPAAQGDVEPVEGGGRRGAVEAERRAGPRDGRARGGSDRRHLRGEAREPVDLGRQVARGEGVPGGEGAALGRGPERLAAVEVPGRPMADSLGREARPVHARRLRREIGDGGQSLGRRGGLRGRGEKRVGRGRRAPGRGDGGREVGPRDLARLDLAQPLRARRRHRRARDAREPRRRHGQRLARLAEIGVHGHRRRQRPERRHLAARLDGGGEHLQRGAGP